MPAPTNTTLATATDIGTLVGGTVTTITQDCRFGGTNYDLWFKYTAVAHDNLIGAFPFGDLTNYQPTITVWLAVGTTLLDISAVNVPIQFPVTAGTTYYLEIDPTGSSLATYSTLTLQVYRHLDLAAPAGSILVNDHSPGFPGVLHAVDGSVLQFRQGMAAGESFAILPDGSRLLADDFTSTSLWLYDATLTRLLTIPYDDARGSPLVIAHPAGHFYAGQRGAGGADHAFIQQIEADGTISDSWTLPAAGLTAFAVNAAETILYHNGAVTSVQSRIRRWDLINDVALADLVADVASYTVFPMIWVAPDDTIVVGYVNLGVDVFVRRYNTNGTTAATYTPSTAVTLNTHLAPDAGASPTTFWLWRGCTASEGNGEGWDVFSEIRLSDGVTVTEFESVQFESGRYEPDAEASPAVRFGHSDSCFFGILSASVYPPESVTGTIDVEFGGADGALSDETLALVGYRLPPRHSEEFCGEVMALAALSPDARQRIFGALGTTLGGSLLYCYESGTSTPLPLYSDSALTVPLPNPVVADASGLMPTLYMLSQAYAMTLRDSSGNLIWSADPVQDVGQLLEATLTALQTSVTAIEDSTEVKFCTTAFSQANSTTLANVIGLTAITLTAAGTYQYEINLSTTAGASGGVKVALKYTTATLTSLEAASIGTTASAVACQHVTSTTDQASLFAQTAAVLNVRITGRIVVNAAGTCAVQMAQNVSDAAATTVAVGSWARFVKVS